MVGGRTGHRDGGAGAAGSGAAARPPLLDGRRIGARAGTDRHKPSFAALWRLRARAGAGRRMRAAVWRAWRSLGARRRVADLGPAAARSGRLRARGALVGAGAGDL